MSEVCPKAVPGSFMTGHVMRLVRSTDRELWKCVKCGFARIDSNQIGRQDVARMLGVVWMPIESAPHDGTPVIVNCPRQGTYASHLNEAGMLWNPTTSAFVAPHPNTVWHPKRGQA